MVNYDQIIRYPQAGLRKPWEGRSSGYSGSTEPWVQQVLHSLVLASHATTVLECGAYLGHTTGWLADAVSRLGGGVVIAVEFDEHRIMQARQFVEGLDVPGVTMDWRQGDVLEVIASLPDKSLQFAWVDDDHDSVHVHTELTLLKPKMAPRGIIAGHDVFGTFGLASVFAAHHGYSLDFPGIHAGHGIGLWQKL